ncbi:MAG TPA: hypothetical protein VN682_22695 [Terriglobales bacterium]|nr:hypothetical protein [Terriglobales bacterium]
MNLESILAGIDEEIARLSQARQLLTGTSTKRGPGRPKLNGAPVAAPKQRKRRRMSAEGRARIAAAQKARWAKAKKAATK